MITCLSCALSICSAYSIFNEDFRELPGTFNAERVDRDIRAGQLWLAVAQLKHADYFLYYTFVQISRHDEVQKLRIRSFKIISKMQDS